MINCDIDVGAELTGKQIKTGIVLIAPDKSAVINCDIDVGVELTGKQIETGIVLIAPDNSSSVIIPPANFVCRGYTVFTLSVRP